MKNVISVSDVQLPNGGYYTGEALDNGYGMIEISGKGKVKNPDGSSYDGSWKYGRPYGYGVYRFADGDFHKGYFDECLNRMSVNAVDEAVQGNFLRRTFNI